MPKLITTPKPSTTSADIPKKRMNPDELITTGNLIMKIVDTDVTPKVGQIISVNEMDARITKVIEPKRRQVFKSFTVEAEILPHRSIS